MKFLPLLVVLLGLGAAAHAGGIAATPAVSLSQERAVHRYPDLGVKGSALNLSFLDVYDQWKIWKPRVLQRDDWPELVAAEAYKVWQARRREEARRAHLGLEEKPGTELRSPHK